MIQEADIHLHVVQDDEIPVWARLSVATVARDMAEAGYATEFARASEHGRQSAYLAWLGNGPAGRQPLARLRLSSSGRRAETWAWGLAPEAQAPGLKPALIDAVEAHARTAGARTLTVLTTPECRPLFLEAGYRFKKSRIDMTADLVRRPVICEWPLRHPRPEDEDEVQAMGRLLYEAYHGTIDDDGETPEDGLAETRRCFEGEYGTFLPHCSFVADGAGGPAGAAWITESSDDTVLLAELLVHPRYRGQGLARPLIQAAMNACLDGGWTKMELVVTRNNVPAEGLYRRMGFKEAPDSEEIHLQKELVD